MRIILFCAANRTTVLLYTQIRIFDKGYFKKSFYFDKFFPKFSVLSLEQGRVISLTAFHAALFKIKSP